MFFKTTKIENKNSNKMFKSSQEIRLNTLDATQYTNLNDSENNVCIFGKYLKTPDAGKFVHKNVCLLLFGKGNMNLNCARECFLHHVKPAHEYNIF